jgi:hypothetical protein
MTDHDAIFKILEQQASTLNKQSGQLKSIEKSLVKIAVQEERLTNIQSQVNALWVRFDSLTAPEGPITKLQQCANSCPGDALKGNIARLWAALGMLLALIGSIKIWG